MFRLRILGFHLWVLMAIVACCGERTPLRPGDLVPGAMRYPRPTLVLAARVDDCLTCSLRGVFIAIRALQHSAAVERVPGLVVLGVAPDPADTLLFRRTLDRERVIGRIERLTARTARRVFHEAPLPAMYLVIDGRIARVWRTAAEGAIVSVERMELVRATADPWE